MSIFVRLSQHSTQIIGDISAPSKEDTLKKTGDDTPGDWNVIINEEPEYALDITSPSNKVRKNPTEANATGVTVTERIKNINVRELLSARSDKFKRKIEQFSQDPNKWNKHSRLSPKPTLINRENKITSIKRLTASMAPSATKNSIKKQNENYKLKSENKLLRKEIQQLKDILVQIEKKSPKKMAVNAGRQENMDVDKRIPGNEIDIPTANRFRPIRSLDLDGAPQMECQPSEDYQPGSPPQTDKDFIEHLRRKNSQINKDNETQRTRRSSPMKEDNTRNIKPKEDRGRMASKKAKKIRPPPIVILFQDIKDTNKLLSTKFKDSNDYFIKRINNTKHIVCLESIDNHKKALDLLTECNVKFFTYTSRADRPHNLLLKGLDQHYSEEEVFEELKSLGLTNVRFIKVTRFQTNRSKTLNIILPIFIIQISPDSEVNALSKVKYIMHQVISWDRLNKREVMQCKRCQRIGHAAANCNLPYRCVKCEEKHEPGKCGVLPGTQLDRDKLFCINCGNYGHPASYRGCTKVVENRKRIIDAKLKYDNSMNTKNQINFNKALLRKDTTFAEAAKNNMKENLIENEAQNEKRQFKDFSMRLDRLEKALEIATERINNLFLMTERLINNLNG